MLKNKQVKKLPVSLITSKYTDPVRYKLIQQYEMKFKKKYLNVLEAIQVGIQKKLKTK